MPRIAPRIATLASRTALAVALAVASAFALASCRSGDAVADAGCVRCHDGLERVSASHEGCVSCHGGDAAARTKDAAHRGLLGLDDPSYPGRWE